MVTVRCSRSFSPSVCSSSVPCGREMGGLLDLGVGDGDRLGSKRARTIGNVVDAPPLAAATWRRSVGAKRDPSATKFCSAGQLSIAEVSSCSGGAGAAAPCVSSPCSHWSGDAFDCAVPDVPPDSRAHSAVDQHVAGAFCALSLTPKRRFKRS